MRRSAFRNPSDSFSGVSKWRVGQAVVVLERPVMPCRSRKTIIVSSGPLRCPSLRSAPPCPSRPRPPAVLSRPAESRSLRPAIFTVFIQFSARWKGTLGSRPQNLGTAAESRPGRGPAYWTASANKYWLQPSRCNCSRKRAGFGPFRRPPSPSDAATRRDAAARSLFPAPSSCRVRKPISLGTHMPRRQRFFVLGPLLRQIESSVSTKACSRLRVERSPGKRTALAVVHLARIRTAAPLATCATPTDAFCLV